MKFRMGSEDFGVGICRVFYPKFVFDAVCLYGDGFVSGLDLAILLGNWGGSGIGDINGSGTVDGMDLSYLLSAWNS